jgi:hypothetical protein
MANVSGFARWSALMARLRAFLRVLPMPVRVLLDCDARQIGCIGL